jgi:uncharacterized SAM-binding protein YcdF (DUF218 family)
MNDSIESIMFYLKLYFDQIQIGLSLLMLILLLIVVIFLGKIYYSLEDKDNKTILD